MQKKKKYKNNSVIIIHISRTGSNKCVFSKAFSRFSQQKPCLCLCGVSRLFQNISFGMDRVLTPKSLERNIGFLNNMAAENLSC